MGKQRQSFTPEFKREALRLVRESGRPLTQTARELGVKVHTLRAWKRQADVGEREGAGGLPEGKPTSESEEIRQLRRELDRVRQERDFLKNWSRANRAIC